MVDKSASPSGEEGVRGSWCEAKGANAKRMGGKRRKCGRKGRQGRAAERMKGGLVRLFTGNGRKEKVNVSDLNVGIQTTEYGAVTPFSRPSTRQKQTNAREMKLKIQCCADHSNQ